MVKRWNIKRLIKEIERLDDEPVKEHIDLKQIYGDSVPMAQLEAEHFTEPQPIAIFSAFLRHLSRHSSCLRYEGAPHRHRAFARATICP